MGCAMDTGVDGKGRRMYAIIYRSGCKKIAAPPVGPVIMDLSMVRDAFNRGHSKDILRQMYYDLVHGRRVNDIGNRCFYSFLFFEGNCM
jgi:hypothetical protein